MKRITLILLMLALAIPCLGATKLADEDFDDQDVDAPFASPIYQYTDTWHELSSGQYAWETGRGGSGYCLSSGTVRDPFLWINPVGGTTQYFSFWLRFPSYTQITADENVKITYPHWSNGGSLELRGMGFNNGGVQCTLYNESTWVETSSTNFTGLMDGNWHRIEVYIDLTGLVVHVWYDRPEGNWTDGSYLKFNYHEAAQSATFTWNEIPSFDSSPASTFSRQVDDIEIWDGMPDSTPAPAPPTLSNVTISNGSFR